MKRLFQYCISSNCDLGSYLPQLHRVTVKSIEDVTQIQAGRMKTRRMLTVESARRQTRRNSNSNNPNSESITQERVLNRDFSETPGNEDKTEVSRQTDEEDRESTEAKHTWDAEIIEDMSYTIRAGQTITWSRKRDTDRK